MGCILRWQLYQIEKDKLNIWDTLLEHKKDCYILSNKIVKLRYFAMSRIRIALRDAVYWSDGPEMGSLFHLGRDFVVARVYLSDMDKNLPTLQHQRISN